MSPGLTVLKGHGTENDFIVLPDLDASLSLSPALVRALCDRHGGIGADGVLRVVRTALATEPDVLAQAGSAEFFMDYHNADGSIAEMCGNGVRLFGRYLRQSGLIDGPTTIATRGGTKSLSFDGADVLVDMGVAVPRPERPTVTVAHGPSYPSVAFDLPNPHVVVELESVRELLELDLSTPPVVQPPLPDGQNVEFFVRTGADQVRMRVHERGVGETRSCGTGICAVGQAAAGQDAGTQRLRVEIPGGHCEVWWTEQDHLVLSGPAVFVASVELDEQWLATHR
ncbi:MAG: diaminopimelate epimerase [Actinomycetota bacterium]|nr:diaminopimelate epimerase [Actinomycetota bacterium]MDQ2955665.1 diaminopimelate epimerase [Actinomycetota bacterium]